MAGVLGQRRKRLGDRARSQAWQSMRIMLNFDIAQIQATADISKDNAKRFIRRLEVAGYLGRVRNHVSGRAGSRIVYRLLRNSGPAAPVPWMDGRVYDPNLDMVFGEAKEE